MRRLRRRRRGRAADRKAERAGGGGAEQRRAPAQTGPAHEPQAGGVGTATDARAGWIDRSRGVRLRNSFHHKVPCCGGCRRPKLARHAIEVRPLDDRQGKVLIDESAPLLPTAPRLDLCAFLGVACAAVCLGGGCGFGATKSAQNCLLCRHKRCVNAKPD